MMQRFNLKRAKILIAAYEAKNFTEAAAMLPTSQQNVSGIIGQIEQDLGVKLFVRGSKSHVPTEIATTLYKRLKAYVKSVEALEKSINEEISQIHNTQELNPWGKVRVGIDCNLYHVGVRKSSFENSWVGGHTIPKYFKDNFKNEHCSPGVNTDFFRSIRVIKAELFDMQGVEIEFYNYDAYQLIEKLKFNEVDIAIMLQPSGINGFKDRKLNLKNRYEEASQRKMFLAKQPSYPLHRPVSNDWDYLKSNYVFIDWGPKFREFNDEKVKPFLGNFNVKVVFNNAVDAISYMYNKPERIAYLPGWMILSDYENSIGWSPRIFKKVKEAPIFDLFDVYVCYAEKYEHASSHENSRYSLPNGDTLTDSEVREFLSLPSEQLSQEDKYFYETLVIQMAIDLIKSNLELL